MMMLLKQQKKKREKMAKAPFDVEEYKAAIDVEELAGEAGFSTMERTGIRPSFDICEFGVDILAKAQKQFFLQKLMRKSQPVWCQTKIMRK